MATASAARIEKVLNVRGPLLDRALVATRHITEGTATVLPAWRRYDGVVWSHLDPETLAASQHRRILVPSALYGLTTAHDAIADYRLKMNVVLPSVGNLASFWRPHLTAVLERKCKGATVVDLLPKEHSAAIDFKALESVCSVLHVAFVSHDGQRAVGHAAKAVKGVVAREAVLGRIDGLREFQWEGWRAADSGEELLIVAP